MSTATVDRQARRLARANESLSRARSRLNPSQSENDIIRAFAERGIDATPRVDVFTYAAWFALGRQVRKGEKSVQGLTWIPIPPSAARLASDPSAKGGVRPKTYYVFHVSQTDPIPGREHEYNREETARNREESAAFARSMGANC